MISELLRGLDAFGQSLPKFILRGKDRMQSRLSGVVTLIINLCVLMFATLKFSYFITRNKPTMFSYLKDNDYSINGEEINLSERNFKIAVTIEDFNEPSK